MAVNGFDDAKNKVSVYTAVEIDTNKQDKHITAHIPLYAAVWTYNSTLERYEQGIEVSGVTSNNTIIVSPDPSYSTVYVDSMIVCAGQGISGGAQEDDILIFVCNPDKVPTSDIWVNVLILGG